MSDIQTLGPWLRRFLCEHIVTERNLTRNTRNSYRDTFALLLPFLSGKLRKPVDRLTVRDLTSRRLLDFLAHLEDSRGCSVQTRNQRLTAIRAFARFVGSRDPAHVEWCGHIRAIQSKKATPQPIAWLTTAEIEALIGAPDRKTLQGRTECALLLFLFNTGARVSEAAQLKVRDLHVARSDIMPSSEGFVQGYNAQAAVDIDSHLVVAEHVSEHTNDKQELAPALRCLDERQEAVGRPRALLADAGYFSDENVKRCEAEGIEPYIARGRERHHRPLAERLAPVPECPAPADGVAAMGHRMKTPEGRALYAKRKSTVETVFGVVKEVMGFRRFHLRGLEAVQGEWALVCMAWNLKRMHVAVA